MAETRRKFDQDFRRARCGWSRRRATPVIGMKSRPNTNIANVTIAAEDR
jgi:hypothetical protein